MPTKILLANMNAGELGKSMKYRTDIDQRARGVALQNNADVLTQGGNKRRAGTRRLNDTTQSAFAIEFPSAGISTDSHLLYLRPISQESMNVEAFNVTTNTSLTSYGEMFYLGNSYPSDFLVLNDTVILFFEDQSPIEIVRDGDNFKLRDFVFMPPLGADNLYEDRYGQISFPSSQRLEGFDDNQVYTQVDNIGYDGDDPAYQFKGTLNFGANFTKVNNSTNKKELFVTLDSKFDGSSYNSLVVGARKVQQLDNTYEIEFLSIPIEIGIENRFIIIDKVTYEIDYDNPFPVVYDETLVDDGQPFLVKIGYSLNYADINKDRLVSSEKELIDPPNAGSYYAKILNEISTDNGIDVCTLDVNNDLQYQLREGYGVALIPHDFETSEIQATNPVVSDGYNLLKSIAISENDDATNLTEYFGVAETVNKTVDLGTVLGEWTFRTNGNWTGTIKLQRNSGAGWKTIQSIESKEDYNVNINDGSEGIFGVVYQLILDFTTASGTQVTDAQYTFTKTGDAETMIIVNGKPLTDIVPIKSNIYSEPHNLSAQAVIFHQQRLWIAHGSDIYYSETNNLNNFSLFGTFSDEKPSQYRLADTRSAKINWLHVAGENMIIGTSVAQWLLTSDGGVLTPSTTRAVKQNNYPTCQHKPIDTGSEFVFLDSSRKRLYVAQYDYTIDSYNAQDLTVYNPDILSAGVDKIVFDGQSRIFYILTLDGKIKTLNYDASQGVIGFANMVINDTSSEITVTDLVSFIGYDGNVETYMVTQRQELLKVDNDITGDYYINSTADDGDIFLYTALDAVFMRTPESELWRKVNLTAEMLTEMGTDPLELMIPIEMRITTFPLEFGSGMQSTFTKIKNINKVYLLAISAGAFNISWKGGESESLVLNAIDELFDYFPEVDGEFEIHARSGNRENLELTITESSPNKTIICGILIEYDQTR